MAGIGEQKWRAIRERVCSGEPVKEVAAYYGITAPAIYSRRKAEGWLVCKPDQSGGAGLEREHANIPAGMLAKSPEVKPLEDLDNQQLTAMAEDLLTVAKADPARFDQAAGDFAQAMIAAGIGDIPPPRTISELTKWEALRRQFKGLDSKTAPGGLFDPVRPLRRATRSIVEAETVRPSGDTTRDLVEAETVRPSGDTTRDLVEAETARPSEADPDPLAGFEV